MKLPESKIKFVCGLSSGESLVEGRGVLEKVPGELSPWWKLQKHIKDNNLEITSFGLWVGDRHYNLPSKTPKFDGTVPLGYNCFRMVGTDGLSEGGRVEYLICAEALFDNHKIQLWINELDDRKSWVTLVEVEN